MSLDSLLLNDGVESDFRIVPLSSRACEAAETYATLSEKIISPASLSQTYSDDNNDEAVLSLLEGFDDAEHLDVITGLRSCQGTFANAIKERGGQAIGVRDGCFTGGWLGWDAAVRSMTHLLTATEGCASLARALGTEATAVGSLSAESWQQRKKEAAEAPKEAMWERLAAVGVFRAEDKHQSIVVAWAGGYGERYEAAFEMLANSLASWPREYICIVCPHPSAKARQLERGILDDSEWAKREEHTRAQVCILGDAPGLEGIGTSDIVTTVASCVGTFDSTVSIQAMACGIPAFHVVPSWVLDAPDKPGESPVRDFVTIASGLTPPCTTPEEICDALRLMATGHFTFNPAELQHVLPQGAAGRAANLVRGLLRHSP